MFVERKIPCFLHPSGVGTRKFRRRTFPPTGSCKNRFGMESFVAGFFRVLLGLGRDRGVHCREQIGNNLEETKLEIT